MCVSEGRVIGICGGTCVGKTTVAKVVAGALGWRRRDCGGAVVDWARARGVALGEVGRKGHEEVDRATRACVVEGAREGVVVEGRYLHYVLAGVRGCRVVELTCGRGERVRRYGRRSGAAEGGWQEAVEASDRNDRELCGWLYEVTEQRVDEKIETTKLSPEAVARRILCGIGTEGVSEPWAN